MIRRGRQQAKRSVNQVMVQAYWQVGRLIVEFEQGGQERATYGARLLDHLASRLTAEFGKGFAVQSLRNYRQLYLTFPGGEIRSTPWSELGWSHVKTIMRVTDPSARQGYAREAVAQTWSVAALDRQISTFYYQRLLSSQDQDSVKAVACSTTCRPKKWPSVPVGTARAGKRAVLSKWMNKPFAENPIIQNYPHTDKISESG